MGAWYFVAWVVFATCAAPAADAQLARGLVRCRKSIGKGVRKLADTVVKERGKCHKSRMQGALTPNTDCNDPTKSPASAKVAAAELKLAALTERGCAGLVPADNNYAACPAPCDSIAISDFASVAACFVCFTEQRAGEAVATAYGTPPAPAGADSVACQDDIGQALRKYCGARMKDQQRCQLAEDRRPTPVDCQTADLKGRVAKARASADARIAKCAAGAFMTLDSCGTDLPTEQGCIKATVDLHADALFDAVYRPTVPMVTATPTRTPTATPSPTAPGPTATPTDTPAPTDTPTPTNGPPTATPTATNTPPLVVGMTAYRPQSEAYGAPFQRQAVPNGQNVNPGVGIRINGDDDNNNGIADRNDTSVGGENDLIEVTLAVNLAPAPPGIEYALTRSSANIKVWNSQTKGTAVLDSNDESVLSFGSTTQTVWVEDPNGGSASLTLEARTTPGGVPVASDQVFFHPFSSVVIALGGQGQSPSDPPDPNHGVFNIAATLYAEGYDVHMYDTSNVDPAGAGAVYNEVVRAVQGRAIALVAIFGYSHGGGSTHDLAGRLDSNRASIGTFTFPYTAYIDGIKHSSDIDIASETRLPPATLYHVNYYQRNDFFIRGNSVPGANVDVNVTNTPWGSSLVHTSVDDHPNVRSGVHDPLVQHVAP